MKGPDGEPVSFANIALFNHMDSSLVKVEATNEAGIFTFYNLPSGSYYINANYLGLKPFSRQNIQVKENQTSDLGILAFAGSETELTEMTVTARRALVEIRPDRTVFNVDGTINSVGSDGLALLRKAPGVTVDNNDNINVLGRTGVLVYVDGKRMPFSGQDLAIYLQSLTAAQIDRIEIISNPGARYEAEGNAGIIDIRLKKDKNLGANGALNATTSRGRYWQYNVNGNGNYRNKKMNLFGSLGHNGGDRYMDMDFTSYQNGIYLGEIDHSKRNSKNFDGRLGLDYFLTEKSTLGLLASAGNNQNSSYRYDQIDMGKEALPLVIDSILIAETDEKNPRTMQSYNLNYRFDNKKSQTVNVDFDYAFFRNDRLRNQPNRYLLPDKTTLLSEEYFEFQSPTDIDILTGKVDFSDNLWKGTVETGLKFSRVITDNTFLFFDETSGALAQNDHRSNRFKYDENVYAAYVNYARAIRKNWNVSAGLRAEQTDAHGVLTAFLPELQKPPVDLNYLSWFPSAGITWQVTPKHNLGLNYSRRINRPDYNVLNPFNNQISQLSFEKGNPDLKPEIVNNLELGYTLHYRYNFKLAYSKTIDQITRLIGPDDSDPRASFIKWDNLAVQKIWSFNASMPVEVTPKWNAYFNFSASHINNQADYGADGGIVDLQAFSYSIYQQQTITLPKGFTGEISGHYSGPGIWGGVFVFKSNWGLNLGLQRKFLRDRLQARLSASDIFLTSGWRGKSVFNGLESGGKGNWDSRRIALSLGYRFGNDNVKSRKRSTGLDEEAKRVGN